MLSIGAAAAVIRWTAMALEPPAAVLPAVQCLHALSFGATHLGTLAFVARVAPLGLATTVQGYILVALGLAMAVAMGISGVLYGRYGGLAYGAMAVAACAGGLCALAAHRTIRAPARD
jgi:PPP family 3-phenylpropionic acid transporter